MGINICEEYIRRADTVRQTCRMSIPSFLIVPRAPKPRLCYISHLCPSNLQPALVGPNAGAATCRICPEAASASSAGMPARAHGVLHRGAVQVTALPTNRPCIRRSAAALHMLNTYLYSNTSTTRAA